jgi:hypothetical protein
MHYGAAEETKRRRWLLEAKRNSEVLVAGRARVIQRTLVIFVSTLFEN